MNRRLRTALIVSTTLSAALVMTACQGNGSSTALNAGPSATAGSPDPTTGTAAGGGSGTSDPSAAASSSSGGGTAASGTSGSKSSGSTGGSKSGTKSGTTGGTTGNGQACGANDISWSTKSETQAGGYILIMAKAKPGITCVLPGGLPTVSFGSDGTEAKPAEQVAGDPITLRTGVTAYAGMNPKTTNVNGGKELQEIILSIGNNDPNPVSLKVGTITIDQPIVTDWHTSATQAVPFSGTDQ